MGTNGRAMVISNLRRYVAVGLLIAGVCAPVKPEEVALGNNRIDDACGEPVPPGPVAGVTMNNGEPAVEWSPIASALVYDVVYGDLGLLHSSGGDFTAATQGCMAYQASVTWARFDPIPGLGQGYWLLVRGDNCAGAGTYDSGDPAQKGSRDAEIEASGHSCTLSVCGDGICNFGETTSSCPVDCPPVCGDGTCDGTETCSSCTADCGVCPPVCGDGLCNGTETPASCPGDCPP